ncbi:arrestin domain-containing protein 1-like [Wyeomyia smithii]|uniref:arrestin domain-containing protein 1-like n=1 Tax=Wyeomyia smithii TaxID=174621 RepID=UPI002467AE53|nr:arrestin domain-containing protein 1-like [Wyeomyia smithii]
MGKKEKPSRHIKCEIRFDNNPLAIYRPGDAVTGFVELTLLKNKKFRGICLRINGFASTYWGSKVKNGSTNYKKRNISFKGREDYFNTISYLVGSDVGNPLEIVAGSYSYPFSVVIPANAPASMEGTFGHIRYMIQLTLERPWKHDIVNTAPFTVRVDSDLNLLAETLSLPTKAETVSCFYFGLTEPLVVTATTPRSGYAPGEVIEMVMHVNNQSIVDIRTILVKLQRVDTFISQVPWVDKKVEYTVLEERYTGKISRRHNARFEENILIGAGTPSNDSLCRIVYTQYEIEIVVHPSRSRKRPTLRLPIVLGTEGLTSSNLNPEAIIEKQRLAMADFRPPSAPPAQMATSEAMAIPPPPYTDLPQNSVSTFQSYSLEGPAENECAKGSEPYTPRDY